MVVLIILVAILLFCSLDLSERKSKFQRGIKSEEIRNQPISVINSGNRNVHSRLFDFDILYYDFEGV